MDEIEIVGIDCMLYKVFIYDKLVSGKRVWYLVIVMVRLFFYLEENKSGFLFVLYKK